MKYDFQLDMQSDNSNSVILREIKPNSTVLEFGPAHGRMTRYLKEVLNCNVTIIEKDKDSGEYAAQFAVNSFIGQIEGDIEQYCWRSELSNSGTNFDYIIFADVLEHLYSPWGVLKSATQFLKEDGSIFVSIPNVSHNSVIIDLINNNFQYRELGLLDNTHIRFFTRRTLLEMVEWAGLFVSKKLDTKCAVEHTEFQNSLNDVPPDIANFLSLRNDGNIYQFVWELRKK